MYHIYICRTEKSKRICHEESNRPEKATNTSANMGRIEQNQPPSMTLLQVSHLHQSLLDKKDPSQQNQQYKLIIMDVHSRSWKKAWILLALSIIFVAALLLLLLLVLLRVNKTKPEQRPCPSKFVHEAHNASGPRANTPPRGWNSYDSFSWTINEEQFLSNAKILSSDFLRFGYQYAVVDFLWYRQMGANASVFSSGFDLIDEWGRPVPDPVRWPSSAGGVGFKGVSAQVHQMGLKFGIHVMRGISTQAINANTPILDTKGGPFKRDGRIWRAKDIALSHEPCRWMSACFTSINISLPAGLAFLNSLYQLYAEWNVDFVKHDCVFGDDLTIGEIRAVSEILKAKDHPILYSISPGTHVTPTMAEKIKDAVNMYRVTGDDWDSWRDVVSHYDVARDFAEAGFIGDKGLLGNSWPDLDMLPFGWLTDPNSNQGPHRNSSLTLDEEKSQMTLWAMAKSPLFLGGDLRNMDAITFSVITNTALLNIHNTSFNNRECCAFQIDNVRTWVANGLTGEVYSAIFNLDSREREISVKLEDLTGSSMVGDGKCRGFDVWDGRELGEMNQTFVASVAKHGCVLLVLNCG